MYFSGIFFRWSHRARTVCYLSCQPIAIRRRRPESDEITQPIFECYHVPLVSCLLYHFMYFAQKLNEFISFAEDIREQIHWLAWFIWQSVRYVTRHTDYIIIWRIFRTNIVIRYFNQRCHHYYFTYFSGIQPENDRFVLFSIES